MDKLKQLLSRCKCGVFLSVNEHRDVYISAAQAIEEFEDRRIEIDPAIREKMIELDTIIELHYFPHTPAGSYTVVHYDLDAALQIALDCTRW